MRNSSGDRQGPRPIQPGHDMRAVAELIEVAFADRLDETGRRMIRSMRLLGGAGWLGWLVARLALPPAAYPEGFVWQDRNRLVGNASLLRVDGYPRRWVLANVAVFPGWRRQGIARTLVEDCIRLARQRGGKEVVLQVDTDNRGARLLYDQLGFETVATRSSWAMARWPHPALGADPHFMPRTDDEYAAHWRLVQASLPEGLVWPFPLRSEIFQVEPRSRLLGIRRQRHWAWHNDDGRPVGFLTAALANDSRYWRFFLAVEPEYRGQIEGLLVEHALPHLEDLALPISMEYPPGPADVSLRSLGFDFDRTLTWMSLDLMNGPDRQELTGDEQP